MAGVRRGTATFKFHDGRDNLVDASSTAANTAKLGPSRSTVSIRRPFTSARTQSSVGSTSGSHLSRPRKHWPQRRLPANPTPRTSSAACQTRTGSWLDSLLRSNPAGTSRSSTLGLRRCRPNVGRSNVSSSIGAVRVPRARRKSLRCSRSSKRRTQRTAHGSTRN